VNDTGGAAGVAGATLIDTGAGTCAKRAEATKSIATQLVSAFFIIKPPVGGILSFFAD
jgi:hypothetical protein